MHSMRAMWARALTFAAQPPSSKREALRALKRHVLSVYKHIHPDRLARHPSQRAVNEASFQLLQAAVDQHFTVPASTPPSPVPHNLTFFAAHHSSTTPTPNPSQSPPTPPGYIRLSVRLSPGPAGLAAALTDLSSALGLAAPPTAALHHAHSPSPPPVTLDAVVRHARATPPGPRPSPPPPPTHIVLRHALQRSTGVTLSIAPDLPRGGLSALRRLARILPSAPAARAPLVIVLHSGRDTYFTPDPPLLHLSALASDSTWKSALCDGELTLSVGSAIAQAAALRDAETIAARVLGVRLVLCESDSLRTEYESLIHQLATQPTHLQTEMVDLAVMVTATRMGGDIDAGVLHVPVSQGVQGVQTAVASSGSLARAARAASELRQRAKRTVEGARRALGVARLERGDGLSDVQWASVVARLRANAERLRPKLAGVALIVGTETKVTEPGAIEIAFDAEFING